MEQPQFESVKDYMSKQLITFTPETDIRDAIDSILKNKISGAPVLNGNKELVGILSEKDCLRIVMLSNYFNEPNGMGKVADFMSHEVKTVSGDLNVVEVAHEFIHSHFRRFPVVDKEGKLMGQVSRRDILRAVKKIHPKEKVVPSSWVGREPHP